MKAAIDAGLGHKKGPNGEELDPLTGKALEQAPAKAEHAKQTETHHANGKPKKDDKGQDLDAEGKPVEKQAPKARTAAELELSPEEKRHLNSKTQARFGELVTTLKTHETTIARQAEDIKGLSEARDAIMSVLEETHTTQEQLASYLEFNALLQSDQSADLERALSLIEQQRTALYEALGREPQGGDVDLLKDFPDLRGQVEEEEITRQAAIEIAQARRERSAREQASTRQREQQSTQQQSRQQLQEQAKAAQTAIAKWADGLAASDLDYKAKEDKLLTKVDDVMKKYPPHLWLSTLQMMYEGIEVQKAPAAPDRGQRPLRPSGARPGTKEPGNMFEAISTGLGHGEGRG